MGLWQRFCSFSLPQLALLEVAAPRSFSHLNWKTPHHFRSPRKTLLPPSSPMQWALVDGMRQAVVPLRRLNHYPLMMNLNLSFLSPHHQILSVEIAFSGPVAVV